MPNVPCNCIYCSVRFSEKLFTEWQNVTICSWNNIKTAIHVLCAQYVYNWTAMEIKDRHTDVYLPHLCQSNTFIVFEITNSLRHFTSRTENCVSGNETILVTALHFVLSLLKRVFPWISGFSPGQLFPIIHFYRQEGSGMKFLKQSVFAVYLS